MAVKWLPVWFFLVQFLSSEDLHAGISLVRQTSAPFKSFAQKLHPLDHLHGICTLWITCTASAPFGSLAQHLHPLDHLHSICTLWITCTAFAPFGSLAQHLHPLDHLHSMCTLWITCTASAPFGSLAQHLHPLDHLHSLGKHFHPINHLLKSHLASVQGGYDDNPPQHRQTFNGVTDSTRQLAQMLGSKVRAVYECCIYVQTRMCMEMR